jgi:hypothetical protein
MELLIRGVALGVVINAEIAQGRLGQGNLTAGREMSSVRRLTAILAADVAA